VNIIKTFEIINPEKNWINRISEKKLKLLKIKNFIEPYHCKNVNYLIVKILLIQLIRHYFDYFQNLIKPLKQNLGKNSNGKHGKWEKIKLNLGGIS